MAQALAPLLRLALLAAPMLALGCLSLALRERRPRSWPEGRGLPAGAAAGLGLAAAAALGGLPLLAAGLCLGAAAALGLLSWRTRAGWREAEQRTRETVALALEGLEAGEEAASVSVRGRLEGDPPAYGPLSAKPCLRFRLEVSRAAGLGGEEPVFLEEGGADRLVLRDRDGRLALGSEARLPRGPLEEQLAVEGRVDAGEWQERPAARRRIARLARAYDPDPPSEGACRYRVVERILPDGLEVRAVGPLARRGGEAVLERPLLCPEPPGAPSARGLRREAALHAVAAAASAAAGWLWLLGG